MYHSCEGSSGRKVASIAKLARACSVITKAGRLIRAEGLGATDKV